jgi:hypothetical protein
MIKITDTLIKGEWWVEPFDDGRFKEPEPPSTYPRNTSVFDLEKELPPLLYGRYCMLCVATHGEWYDGLGYVLKDSDGKPVRMYICEEE